MDERNVLHSSTQGGTEFIKENQSDLHESAALCTVVTLYEGKNEQEANGEINLPDYYGNADKILFTTATPVLSDVYIENGKAGYEGKVIFNVTFLTSDGELKSIGFDGDFDGSCDIPDGNSINPGSCSIDVRPFTDSAVCRLTSPKRIIARCKVNTSMRVTCMKCVEPIIDGNIGIEEELLLQRKIEHSEALHTVHFEENDIQFSDDIELDGNMPPIDEIITCFISISPDECKLANNSVAFHGNAFMNCIYRSPSGGYNTLTKKLPLLEHFDIPAELQTDKEISLYITVCPPEVSAVAAENSFGEKRIIELDFTYGLEAECLYNSPVSVTRDIYSTDYACTPEYGNIEIGKLCRAVSTNFTVNASQKHNQQPNSYSYEKTSENLPGSENKQFDSVENSTQNNQNSTQISVQTPTILYSDAAVKNIDSETDETKGRVIINGNAEIYMLLTDGNTLRGITFTVSFKTELDGYGVTGNIPPLVNVSLSPIHYRADSENVYADFEVMMNVVILSSCSERVITKLTVDKTTPIGEKKRPSILIYYPKKGEQFWDIAKKHYTTVEELKFANHLQGDITIDDAVIIVPQKKKKT